jgi:hypothetical protein
MPGSPYDTVYGTMIIPKSPSTASERGAPFGSGVEPLLSPSGIHEVNQMRLPYGIHCAA